MANKGANTQVLEAKKKILDTVNEIEIKKEKDN